jgi:hypothetical protein
VILEEEMAMRTIIAFPLLALLVAPGPVLSDDHLVASDDMASRLSAAAAAHDQDRAALDRLLASPSARSAAASLGTDAGRLRAGLAALTDSELSDLTARAAALGLDPAAGHSLDTNDVLTVFLVVAIVILVLGAV